ncbi:MAG: tetratricopeptide repeat protein [Thermoguttaceae bacterium]
MRRLNLRMLAWLFAGGAVLAGAVHLLHEYQIRRNAEMFLREARSAAEAEKKADAVKYYQQYLKFFPGDATALADFGLLMADLPGGRFGAYQAMERALWLDPSRTDVRRRLAAIEIEMGRGDRGRFKDAREHLGLLLDESPQDPDLLLLLGRCQEGLEQYDSAQETLRKVIGLAPQQLEAYGRLASLLRDRLEKIPEADSWMLKMVSANSNSCRAHVLRGQYLRVNLTKRSRDERAKRSEESLREANQALRLEPNDAEALLLSASCALEKKDFAVARSQAQQAIQSHPGHVPAYTVLADIEVQAGNRKEAIQWLQRGVEHAAADAPIRSEILWHLANLLVDEERTEEALKITEEIASMHYPEALVGYLRGRIDVVNGQWLEASRRFEQLRPELTIWPDIVKQADFWLGQCYERLGSADQQLAAYRRAASADPLWAPARAGVAGSLLASGRLDEALDEYRQVMKLENAPVSGLLRLAQLEIVRNLRLKKADRDWSEAERLLKVAQGNLPDAVQIPILQAEIRVGQDRGVDAAKLLEEAHQKRPRDLELRIALASLAERQQQWERAAKYLNEAEQQLGDSVPLRLAQAQHLVRQFGKEAAQRLHKFGEQTQKLPEKDLPQLWRGLAGASLAVEDYQQARRLCQRLSEREATNLQVRLLLFDLALQAGDGSGLDRVLEEIHGIEGSGPFWHYGQALLLMLRATALSKDAQKPSETPPPISEEARKLLEEAQTHLSEVAQARPGWSRVPFLAAEVFERQGNELQAVENYQKAVELGERSPRAIYRLVLLMLERHRYLEADRVLSRLQEQRSPFSTDLTRLAAEVSFRLEDFDRALELARRNAANSKDYRDHLWLGRVLGISGQRAKDDGRRTESESLWREAEKELRTSVELAKNSAVAWVSVVQFLAGTGQKERAMQALKEAQARIPAKEAPLALAQCFEALGDISQAEKNYQKALDAAPRDAATVRQVTEFFLRSGKSQQAEAQLKRFTSGEVPASEADAVWARRALALTLVGRGEYRYLKQGLDLVDQNLARTNPTIQDQRAKAVLLASHPLRQRRRDAAELLEKVLQQPDASAEDRFVAAKLYLRQGDWGHASRHFRSLLAQDSKTPQYPQYLATYISAVLARQEISEAELWIPRLETIAPEQLSTVLLRAQILCQRGEYDAVIGRLKGYLDLPASQKADRPARIALVATSLEQLGQTLGKPEQKAAALKFTSEAESLLRTYANGGANEKFVLATFLARHERLEEGLGIAERAWKAAKPETIALAMVQFLSRAMGNPSQVKRCEQILVSALETHHRPVPLLLVLADLRSIQERYDEAEAIYRGILKNDPNHRLALNNLAAILALRGKQLDEAQRLIDRAIELAGPATNLLDSRAIVYLARGEFEEAFKEIEEAIADAPSPMLLFHKAEILGAMNRKTEAAAALKEAVKLGFDSKAVHPLERPGYERIVASTR